MEEPAPFLNWSANLLAMSLFPFWLGTMHGGVISLAGFCVLAGAALTIADSWEDLAEGLLQSAGLVEDVVLRTASVAVPASVFFAIAPRFAG